jgi:signal transduction histidine kinase
VIDDTDELRTPLTGILGISSMLKEELSTATSSVSISPSPLSQIAQLSNGSSPFFVPRRQLPSTTATTMLPSMPLFPLSLNATALASPVTPEVLQQRKQSFAGMTPSGANTPVPPPSSSSSSNTNNNGEIIAMVNTLSICTDSLLQVANAVLDISKIEANALVLRNDPLDLRLVVEEVTELARASAIQLKKDVRILCDVSALECPSLLPNPPPLSPPNLTMSSISSSLSSSLSKPLSAIAAATATASSSNDNTNTVASVSSTSSTPTTTATALTETKRCCPYADVANGRCCSGAHVLSDGQRIRQLLINLMNNAVKFTTEGSVTLTVKRVTSRQSKAKDSSTCKVKASFHPFHSFHHHLNLFIGVVLINVLFCC